MTFHEECVERLRILEDENAHHAPRESAAWHEYQALVDILNIQPVIERPESEGGGIWNDSTQLWEVLQASDATKAHDLVQRRVQAAEFGRQYGAYRAADGGLGLTRRLSGGVHDPADDLARDLRSVDDSDRAEHARSRLGSDECEFG